MGALGGLVVTFLGAACSTLVYSGVPFVPLQTLWVNFTTQVFQAIGLGYGKPADDLMERKPRPVDEPIIDRSLFVWLGIASLTLGAMTLGVIAWAGSTRAWHGGCAHHGPGGVLVRERPALR